MLKHLDYIVFDAANTLIHKPQLWVNISDVLQQHGHRIEVKTLRQRHKLLSEITDFPDRTSADFYRQFNEDLLLSLGIIPTDTLLDDLFSACSYLPWEAFEDTHILNQLPVPSVVLSNFNSSLTDKLDNVFGAKKFARIITSENETSRKPELAFYQTALQQLHTTPERLLYIGDSLKLDIIPAQTLGIKALLIDRDEIFTAFPNRLNSLEELNKWIRL